MLTLRDLGVRLGVDLARLVPLRHVEHAGLGGQLQSSIDLESAW